MKYYLDFWGYAKFILTPNKTKYTTAAKATNISCYASGILYIPNSLHPVETEIVVFKAHAAVSLSIFGTVLVTSSISLKLVFSHKAFSCKIHWKPPKPRHNRTLLQIAYCKLLIDNTRNKTWLQNDRRIAERWADLGGHANIPSLECYGDTKQIGSQLSLYCTGEGRILFLLLFACSDSFLYESMAAHQIRLRAKQIYLSCLFGHASHRFSVPVR